MEINSTIYKSLNYIFLKQSYNENNIDIYSIDNIKMIISQSSNYYEIEYSLINIFKSTFIFNKEKTINELLSRNFIKFYSEIKDNPFIKFQTDKLNNQLQEFFSSFSYSNNENNPNDNTSNIEFDFFLNDDFYNKNININIKPLVYLLNYIQISKIKQLIKLTNNADEIQKYLNSVKMKIINNPLTVLYDFIILVFIIQKTMESRLYNIAKEKGFEYDLSSLNNDMNHIVIFIEAIKYIPNISKIYLSENNLGEIGFFYLGESLNYIKSIKELDLSLVFSNSNSFKFFKIGINNKEISNIEKIDLSRNPKFDGVFCFHLSLIIPYFPNLKILNLNCNKLLDKKLSYLFIQMKRLYEMKKCKIEELYLNKIEIKINSLYSLIELLKSRYCLIKIISFNRASFNNFTGKKIFHALTKNKTLEEIYFYNCQFEDYQIKELLKTLPLFTLTKISFCNNKFHCFENILKVLSKTKRIQINNEELNIDNVLYSVDLSSNICKNVTEDDYNLLLSLIKKMEIKLLDISQLLFKNNLFNLNELEKKIEDLIKELYKEKINIIY